MKLVTRAQLGWPASAAPSQSTTRGVKVHYEGTAVSTRLLTDHDACLDEWKNIRRSHLANTAENYSDVAYNYAACPHGYLLEGRGLRRRTGANGSQALNRAHFAILGLVGSSGLTEPPDAMLTAIRDGIDLLRENGAGGEIRGHRDGYATACPGGPLYAWVQKGAPRPTTAPTSPKETDMPLTKDDIKTLATTDGIFKAPPDSTTYATNRHWTLASHIEGLTTNVRLIRRTQLAQVAAIQTLAGLVGKGVNTAAVVDAVEKAIADAVITVDVDINSKEG
ncbi:peptidoglycan recognition family protein [Streptomyces sp. NPDC091649]|uniref:peptidoglycan recognition protein family protein n=1 Tax=Streptomyces sp. NPDC091649 TaxID=3366004 RepID=UPI0037FF11B2